MLNYIWCGMIVISFITALFTGRLDALTQGAMEGATSAVETCIGLLGTMCLWTGIARIAENSGLVSVFARLLRPITRVIFPKLKSDSSAMRAIVMNMVANLLGMGNAATPLGLVAMKELDRENHHSGRASNDMCMLVVINTASIQMIPSTVIALRQMFGSQNPSGIVAPVWICSVFALVVGVLTAKMLQRRECRL